MDREKESSAPLLPAANAPASGQQQSSWAGQNSIAYQQYGDGMGQLQIIEESATLPPSITSTSAIARPLETMTQKIVSFSTNKEKRYV
jgi:hypothetical protein